MAACARPIEDWGTASGIWHIYKSSAEGVAHARRWRLVITSACNLVAIASKRLSRRRPGRRRSDDGDIVAATARA
jgi:hypothetical protein